MWDMGMPRGTGVAGGHPCLAAELAGAAGPVSTVVQASLSLPAPLWPVLPKLLILKYC